MSMSMMMSMMSRGMMNMVLYVYDDEYDEYEYDEWY